MNRKYLAAAAFACLLIAAARERTRWLWLIFQGNGTSWK